MIIPGYAKLNRYLTSVIPRNVMFSASASVLTHKTIPKINKSIFGKLRPPLNAVRVEWISCYKEYLVMSNFPNPNES